MIRFISLNSSDRHFALKSKNLSIYKTCNANFSFSVYYPTFFKKSEGDIVIVSVRPFFSLSIMLSPKPLDEIQPNLVCELLT